MGKTSKYNRRTQTIFSWIHPVALLLVGLACIVPYSMTDSLSIRALQVLVFFVVAVCVKRIKLLYFLCLTFTIIVFYLLKPEGKVLFEYGIISITEGALIAGMFRGFTLMGYIFLSLWCISPSLTLPTRLGVLLTKSIICFEMLIEQSVSMKFKDFVTKQREEYEIKKTSENKDQTQEHSPTANKLVQRLDELLVNTLVQINKLSSSIKIQDDSSSSKSKMLWGLIAIICIIAVAWFEYIIEH